MFNLLRIGLVQSGLNLHLYVFFSLVRSLASVAFRRGNDKHKRYVFNFFSVDFNEELSGLYGTFLQDQTCKYLTIVFIKKVLYYSICSRWYFTKVFVQDSALLQSLKWYLLQFLFKIVLYYSLCLRQYFTIVFVQNCTKLLSLFKIVL